MSIEIQRRSRYPVTLADWVSRVAPHGLNANTQFFLVFLGVLVLHFVAAPIFMRSAGVPEPGEPQRYLTSHGNAAQSTSTATQAESPESVDQKPKKSAAPKPSVSASPVVLTDAVPQPKKPAAIAPPIIPAPAEPAAESRKPVAQPTIPAPAPAAVPQLSDLIADPPSTEKSDPPGSALRAVPQQTPASSGGTRQFRTIP